MPAKGQCLDLNGYKNKYGDIEGFKRWNALVTRKKLILDKNNLENEILLGNAIKCCACGFITTRLQHTHFTFKCKVSSLKEYKQLWPNALTVAPNLAKNQAITLLKMIEKHGEQEGSLKWGKYCERQAETNTLEYKAQQYGWNKEQFKDYNATRACTLKNFILRHGEEIGLIKWNVYCERQKYTTSEKYFKERYGEDDGERRFADFSKGRSCSKFKNTKEKLIFNEINALLVNDKLEYQIHISNIPGCYDFGNHKLKKVIEFNGDYWHCNPLKYDGDFFHLHKQKIAREIWENDLNKYQAAILQGYEIKVIWEHDWHLNSDKIKNEVIRWLNGN
jgi:G:T-mismatch repair DNA endonuclease (very short patch repair protein)